MVQHPEASVGDGEATMGSDVDKLRTSLTELLQDINYMCDQCIKKSSTLLKDAQVMTPETVDVNKVGMRKLLSRMQQNVENFTQKLQSSLSEYHLTSIVTPPCISPVVAALSVSSPVTKKSKLSLLKTGPESMEDGDLDLASSVVAKIPKALDSSSDSPIEDVESLNDTVSSSQNETTTSDAPATSNEKVGATVKSAVVRSIEETIAAVANGDGNSNDSDSDESEKSIELNNFDVASSRQVNEDLLLSLDESLNIQGFQGRDIKDEGDMEEEKCFECRESEDSQEDVKIKVEPETEINGLSAHERLIQTIRHEKDREFLQLLSKATDNDSAAEGDKINEFMLVSSEVVNNKEQEAMEALSQLDDDVTTSSDFELDELTTSCSGSSDVTSCEEEEQRPDTPEEKIQTKPFSINLSRLDSMGESDIDRLCNLHNINRKRCLKSVWRCASKRRLKRQRTLSTSSSDSSSSGSSTSSLPEFEPLPGQPYTIADDANLKEAEMRINHMECSDADDESDSDTDIEKPITPKRKRTIRIRSSDDEPSQDKQITKRPYRDPLLTSSILNDPPENLPCLWSDDSQDGKLKAEVSLTFPSLVAEKEPRRVYDATVISSDSSESSSSGDSDCELIEGPLSQESLSGRGRRNINAVIDDDDLDVQTQIAKSEETQRILRLEEHSRTVECLQSQHESLVLDVDVTTKSPLVTVNRELSSRLKPHQRDGVKFMWEACYESVEVLRDKPGTGCILAHCMGLGKTLQVITLIHTLFAHPATKTKHVVVICPLSTVLNWQNEFKLAFRNLAASERIFNPYFVSQAPFAMKCGMVKMWWEKTGVLVMGYESYSTLISDKVRKGIAPELKDLLRNALVDPGPDLVVCDEGHLLKNGQTLKHQALMTVKTKRRIVLTGTPLQNNLKEYYHMLEFVKPHLLGTYKEYSNRFVNPIMNGQYHDSTAADINLMKKRTHVLNKLLKKTIQRIESSVLKQYLPPILDYTIFITLHPIQASIYRKYIETVTISDVRNADFFKDFYLLKYIGLHPFMLEKYCDLSKKGGKKDKQKEAIDLELTPNDKDTIDQVALNSLERWWRPFCPFDVESDVTYGSKLKVALALLREAERIGDKVLVFSTSLIELDCIEHFLKTQGTKGNGRSWVAGTDYFRMDGTVPPIKRSDLCNSFNDANNTTVKAFLISHRVGGLGLNLTAANRVILIGANFNPCYDTQSIYRAYRFGQTKQCYVYRLLSMGTMEEKVYQKCVVKLAVASTVIDKFHVDRHYASGDLQSMYKYDLDYKERPLPKLPHDKMLATLLQTTKDIYKYHEHQALLENRPEEELNEEEKKLAWDEFNNESLSKNVVAPVPLPIGLEQQLPVAQASDLPGTSASSSNFFTPLLDGFGGHQRQFINHLKTSGAVSNHYRGGENPFVQPQGNQQTPSGFRRMARPPGVGVEPPNNVRPSMIPSSSTSNATATNNAKRTVGAAPYPVNNPHPNPFAINPSVAVNWRSHPGGNEPVRSTVRDRRNFFGAPSFKVPNILNNNKTFARDGGTESRPIPNAHSSNFRVPRTPDRLAVNLSADSPFVQNNRNAMPAGGSGFQIPNLQSNLNRQRSIPPIQGEFNYFSNKYITPP